jgi:hypothetical protein
MAVIYSKGRLKGKSIYIVKTPYAVSYVHASPALLMYVMA